MHNENFEKIDFDNRKSLCEKNFKFLIGIKIFVGFLSNN